MSNYTFTDLRDSVLLWLHGRRLGILGDGGQGSHGMLALDGTVVGATRSGANALKQVATGSAGAGPVAVGRALKGDHVELVVNLTGNADVTASFESIVSVNAQVQQTSGSDLSAQTLLFFVQPQS